MSAVASSARRPDTGQASVELVLVLPFLVTACLAVVQVAVVARRSVLLAHAAREAARAAAVRAAPVASASSASTTAARAASRAASLDPDRLEVVVRRDTEVVAVTVRYRDPTDVALVGRLVGPVTLQERVTMRREDR